MNRFRSSRFAAAVIATGLAAATFSVDMAYALEETLQNDSFSGADAVVFQAGFVAGEMAAARFVPNIDCPCVVESVTLLFGGASGTREMGLSIWNDPAGADAPGGLLFTGEVVLSGSNTALQEIDLSLSTVVVDGPFRVGIEFAHSGLPGVATDTDGTIDAGANFILADFGALFWARAALFGVSGDFILRAKIDNLLADDLDGDGIVDDSDNCIEIGNTPQRDTDGDGFGNACDPDIAPASNDCVVNFGDLATLKASFFAMPGDPNWNADADIDGDDRVNFSDLVVMQAFFFGTPGPSGLVADCS